MKYLNLTIGEIVTDNIGVQWERTSKRDETGSYEDNYYYRPLKCFCNADQGAGYTFNDEYGDCDHCEHEIRQINGHNDSIKDEN